MSYPDPCYFGDKGEISPVFRPAGAEPELTLGASAYHYLPGQHPRTGSLACTG